MKLKYITPKEIEKMVKSLQSEISHDNDGIPMKIVKGSHIGIGTDSITQQSTATLLQALILSHNTAVPYCYRD